MFLRGFTHFRVVKTVLAAFITFILADTIGLSYIIFPVLAACFCIRQTFLSSLRRFSEEFKITVMATMVAMLAGGLIEFNFFLELDLPFLDFLVIALALGVVVMLVLYFGWYDSSLIGMLTVLYILGMEADMEAENLFLLRAFIRLGSVLLGSFIALLIDYLFSGFEYKRLFRKRIMQALSSLDKMVELFVEALMFRSGIMMEKILDLMVETQNMLNYVTGKVEDLEKELDFRPADIRGISPEQVVKIQRLLRDLRLIGFQLEAGAINFTQLMVITEEKGEEMLPETDYCSISRQGRLLAQLLTVIQRAVEEGNPAILEGIEDTGSPTQDFRQFLQSCQIEGEVRFMVTDLLSALNRIEYHLKNAAVLLREYLLLIEK